MKNQYKNLLALACVLASLTACGKKESTTPPPVLQPGNSGAADANVTHTKHTKNGGVVSSIILEPVFAVPGKYTSYVRQEVSEASSAEIAKLSGAALEAYVNTWIKQAGSVANPNWSILAGILHPETTELTNEFKKQEAADKTKSEFVTDKASLNTVVGFEGEIFSLSGPDIETGEYYLSLNPDSRFSSVSYTTKKGYRSLFSYQPVLKNVGMEINCMGSRSCKGVVYMTIKVPLEKAKEIEALREKGKEMIRVYGQVSGIKDGPSYIHKNSASAGLNIEVEAIEVGSRQDGQFKSYFFLDTDQLKRWKQ
jgi:predicted small lipoprotein YifL